jgi:hypothetical protein
LHAAQVNLAYTKIVSPVDGMVITRYIDVGQTVVSSLQSSTLFLIGKDMSKMQVDTNVSEADVGEVQPGQKAAFTVQAYPKRTFIGKVRQVREGPITVQNVVTYDVVVDVDNDDFALLPGHDRRCPHHHRRAAQRAARSAAGDPLRAPEGLAHSAQEHPEHAHRGERTDAAAEGGSTAGPSGGGRGAGGARAAGAATARRLMDTSAGTARARMAAA